MLCFVNFKKKDATSYLLLLLSLSLSYILGGHIRDIRPTIAVTKAHIDLPECREAVATGRLKADGKILLPSGQSICSKAAIEPVWYLPEIARRFQTTESNLRRSIFRMTNGMYPELITRPDIKIFLPPIGGLTIYIWGDPETIPDEDIELTCRVHDECNGSDVFGRYVIQKEKKKQKDNYDHQ